MATALSESSSIHSDALYHLTRDKSGIRLDPMSYSILEREPYKEDPWAEELQSLLQVTRGDGIERVCMYKNRKKQVILLEFTLLECLLIEK